MIKDRRVLLVQTVERMSKRFNLDIRNFSEVQSIDTEKKEITVKNLKTGEIYLESYDELILSPGENPVRPPIKDIEEEDNLFILRNIPDTDAIKDFVDNKNSKEAYVVGGGFIGIEIAENIAERGLKVYLVEMLEQVMAPFDFENAQILHERIKSKGIDLILGDGVEEFRANGRKILLNCKR